MTIVLEDVNGYSVGKYFVSEDGNLYCSRSGDTRSSNVVSVLCIRKPDIHIFGGPKFSAELQKCGKDVAELKALAFRIFKEHLGFDDYLREMDAAREDGRRKGINALKCAFRELMNVE